MDGCGGGTKASTKTRLSYKSGLTNAILQDVVSRILSKYCVAFVYITRQTFSSAFSFKSI